MAIDYRYIPQGTVGNVTEYLRLLGQGRVERAQQEGTALQAARRPGRIVAEALTRRKAGSSTEQSFVMNNRGDVFEKVTTGGKAVYLKLGKATPILFQKP